MTSLDGSFCWSLGRLNTSSWTHGCSRLPCTQSHQTFKFSSPAFGWKTFTSNSKRKLWMMKVTNKHRVILNSELLSELIIHRLFWVICFMRLNLGKIWQITILSKPELRSILWDSRIKPTFLGLRGRSNFAHFLTVKNHRLCAPASPEFLITFSPKSTIPKKKTTPTFAEKSQKMCRFGPWIPWIPLHRLPQSN